MLKSADKHNARLASICLFPELHPQLLAWYNITSTLPPITNKPSKCLLRNHSVSIVVDLLHTSTRPRGNPPPNTSPPWTSHAMTVHTIERTAVKTHMSAPPKPSPESTP